MKTIPVIALKLTHPYYLLLCSPYGASSFRANFGRLGGSGATRLIRRREGESSAPAKVGVDGKESPVLLPMQFPPASGTAPITVDVMTVGHPAVFWPQEDGPLEVVLPDVETQVFRLKRLGPLTDALATVGASKSHLDALAAGNNVQLVDGSSPDSGGGDEDTRLIVTAAPLIDREALVVSVVHGLPEVRRKQ